MWAGLSSLVIASPSYCARRGALRNENDAIDQFTGVARCTPRVSAPSAESNRPRGSSGSVPPRPDSFLLQHQRVGNRVLAGEQYVGTNAERWGNPDAHAGAQGNLGNFLYLFRLVFIG